MEGVADSGGCRHVLQLPLGMRLRHVEGVADSGGCRHSAGVSVSTLTKFPLLTRRTSVEGSRTGLLLEVMASPTHGWPTALSGA